MMRSWGLVEALVARGRIDAEDVVFRPDAAHESGDQPAAGQRVDHRVLLGERQRMLAQRQRAARMQILDRWVRRASDDAMTIGDGIMP